MNRMPKTVNLRRLTSRPSLRFGRLSPAERHARPLMARAFGHPQGAGLLGPGTNSLLRTLFVDALVGRTATTEVILTRADLQRLFNGDFAPSPTERYGAGLQVTATLEDAIESLEKRATAWSPHEAARRLPILWLATPGGDADVVHDTLRYLDGADIIALFWGAWPYGPTHFLDATGPRRLPNQIDLLSTSEAISKLIAAR